MRIFTRIPGVKRAIGAMQRERVKWARAGAITTENEYFRVRTEFKAGKATIDELTQKHEDMQKAKRTLENLLRNK